MVKKAAAPAKAAAAAPVKEKKTENPLFPKRPKNFRIGGDIRVSEVLLGLFACCFQVMTVSRYLRQRCKFAFLLDWVS
jgi:hypothetical protein